MREQRSDTRASWRLRAPDDLAWASWNDEFVAYHRPSGKTHFLNAASHFLLTELLPEPRDTAAIAAIFTSEESHGAGVPGETFQEVLSMLEHFEQLGLIERA